MTNDRVFGGLGVLLACLYVWQASRIQLSFISDPFGPKAFPYLVGGLLGLASLAIFLKPDKNPDWPALPRLLEIAVAGIVLAAYAMLLPEIGFVAATAMASFYLSWRLGAMLLAALLAGIAISVGIFVVFHLILGLTLARGPWGF